MAAWIETAEQKREQLTARLEKGWTICAAPENKDRLDLTDWWMALLADYQKIEDAILTYRRKEAERGAA